MYVCFFAPVQILYYFQNELLLLFYLLPVLFFSFVIILFWDIFFIFFEGESGYNYFVDVRIDSLTDRGGVQ